MQTNTPNQTLALNLKFMAKYYHEHLGSVKKNLHYLAKGFVHNLECRGTDVGKSRSISTGWLATGYVDHVGYCEDLGVRAAGSAVGTVGNGIAGNKLKVVHGVIVDD